MGAGACADLGNMRSNNYDFKIGSHKNRHIYSEAKLTVEFDGSVQFYSIPNIDDTKAIKVSTNVSHNGSK